MKKDRKFYICKALFVGKLALASLLLFIAVKIVLFPAHLQSTFSPVLAVAQDKLRSGEATDPQDFLFNDYSEIVKRNPFGLSQSLQTSKNNSLSSENLLSEELGLALFGTISGSPAVARAIIKNLKTGVLDLYKIGQTIEEARIESIEPDAVILLHNGQKKVLWLNILHLAGNNVNKVPALSTNSVDDTKETVGTSSSSEQNRIPVQPRKTALEAILEEAIIEPYVVNNLIEGLRITGIENIKAAEDLGLKNGDIIRTVNGHRLTTKQNAYQVFKKAMSEQSVGLELIRDGEIEKLSFSLR